MVDFLNENFISTWVLIGDLKALLEHDDPAVRAAAEICEVEHIYPVDSLVISPTGEFIDGLWVQDILGLGNRPSGLPREASKYSGQWSDGYLRFLKDALAVVRDK